jgi:hypothetical protein
MEQYKVLRIEDRKEAIHLAISTAKIGSIVLIAGKGHEDYQEINGVKHHFDDMEAAKECLCLYGTDYKSAPARIAGQVRNDEARKNTSCHAELDSVSPENKGIAGQARNDGKKKI